MPGTAPQMKGWLLQRAQLLQENAEWRSSTGQHRVRQPTAHQGCQGTVSRLPNNSLLSFLLSRAVIFLLWIALSLGNTGFFFGLGFLGFGVFCLFVLGLSGFGLFVCLLGFGVLFVCFCWFRSFVWWIGFYFLPIMTQEKNLLIFLSLSGFFPLLWVTPSWFISKTICCVWPFTLSPGDPLLPWAFSPSTCRRFCSSWGSPKVPECSVGSLLPSWRNHSPLQRCSGIIFLY